MMTKAAIKSAIVNLAGPVPNDDVAATARKTLAWTLGQHGDITLHEVLFGVRPTLTEDDAKADLAGEPRPDSQTPGMRVTPLVSG